MITWRSKTVFLVHFKVRQTQTHSKNTTGVYTGNTYFGTGNVYVVQIISHSI